MRHQMPRSDAVAGIFDALEFLDGGFLDFADHPAERNIARKLNTSLAMASIAISAEASPLFMLLEPSPQIQPSRWIAFG